MNTKATVTLSEGIAAVRAKAGLTTNPAYAAELRSFLVLLDWALERKQRAA